MSLSEYTPVTQAFLVELNVKLLIFFAMALFLCTALIFISLKFFPLFAPGPKKTDKSKKYFIFVKVKPEIMSLDQNAV